VNYVCPSGEMQQGNDTATIVDWYAHLAKQSVTYKENTAAQL